MKATRTTSSGKDLRSIQEKEEALLEIARDEISLAERVACEWIASQERIAIASIESRERLEIARLKVDEPEPIEGEEQGTAPASPDWNAIAQAVVAGLPTILELLRTRLAQPADGSAAEGAKRWN